MPAISSPVLSTSGVWIRFSRLTFAKLASSLTFSLAKSKKQLAKNIERVSEREKSTSQTGEWVCIFTRQS
jgi:hypothetical protein